MKIIITALLILNSIFGMQDANICRIETCKLNVNGIAYYEYDGNIMSEYSDAQRGDNVALFINDNGTSDMTDDEIVWSCVIG